MKSFNFMKIITTATYLPIIPVRSHTGGAPVGWASLKGMGMAMIGLVVLQCVAIISCTRQTRNIWLVGHGIIGIPEIQVITLSTWNRRPREVNGHRSNNLIVGRRQTREITQWLRNKNRLYLHRFIYNQCVVVNTLSIGSQRFQDIAIIWLCCHCQYCSSCNSRTT